MDDRTETGDGYGVAIDVDDADVRTFSLGEMVHGAGAEHARTQVEELLDSGREHVKDCATDEGAALADEYTSYPGTSVVILSATARSDAKWCPPPSR